jgi:hypothetical protein
MLKLFTLVVFSLLLLPLHNSIAQEEAEVTRHSNSERARPMLDEDEYRKAEYPYLQSVPSISAPAGWFLNSNTIVEPGSTPQNESSIAISPVDPNFLIASAVDARTGAHVYISYDGGKSWINKDFGVVNPNWVSGNDPSVGFDYLGNGYVMYGAFPENRTNLLSGVYIAKTTDKGQSWQTHIRVIEHLGTATPDTAFEDKYYIQIDNSAASPFRGYMYTPWKRVIDRDSSTQIVFTRSTDGGLTWKSPIPVSPRKSGTSLDTTFGQSFPISTTGPDGTIYVAWNDGPIRSIGFAKSTDGGLTFSAPSFAKQGYPTLGTPRKPPGGNDVYHVLKGTFRAETYPTIMVDNSDSPRRGWIYLAWAAGHSPKIYFKRSTDGGSTWSQEKMIHSDTTNDKWWPWLSVDQTSGDIAVMYADSRRDPANILIDQFISYSSDGGDSWIDRRATDAVSDYRKNPYANGIFAGDYSGNSFLNGKIYPSFLDTRNNFDNDVYTVVINIRQPYPVDDLVVRGDGENLNLASLHWTNPPKESIFGKPIADYTLVVTRDGAALATLPSSATSYSDVVSTLDQDYLYDVRVVATGDTSVPVAVTFHSGSARNPYGPTLAGANGYKPEIELLVQVPGVRADSTTPLGNLKGYRIYRDGVMIKEGSLAPSDTGKTVTITDQPAERGYYFYRIALVDQADNVSALSDSLQVYAGPTTPYSETFDGTMPRFIIPAGWAATSNLALSAPNSMTDSPTGDYKSRIDQKLQIFPVTMTTAVELTFAQIAIIDPTDSAIVEVSYDKGQSWTIGAVYKSSSYPAWSDNKADAGDWRQERLVLVHPNPGPNSFGLVRFRLKSGSFTNADGWYIDDINFGATAGVDLAEGGSERLSTRAYPNPFTSASIIEFNLPHRTHVTARVFDVMGRQVALMLDGTLESGRHSVTFDGSELPAGTYLYEILTESGVSRGNLLLAR